MLRLGMIYLELDDFFTIQVECYNFLNLYGRHVLQFKSFLTYFLLIDATF